MRKSSEDAQPFEEIVDDRGRRYASGADLVRPEADEEEAARPRRLPIWLLIGIMAALIAAAAILLPYFDRQAMRTPMVNATAAVRAKNMAQLEACFTPDGTVGTAGLTLKARTVIRNIGPYLDDVDTGTLRFIGFENIQRAGRHEWEADFTVAFDYTDESLLDDHVPVRKTGHVTLRRLGYRRWRIVSLTSEEPEFGDAIGEAMNRPADNGTPMNRGPRFRLFDN